MTSFISVIIFFLNFFFSIIIFIINYSFFIYYFIFYLFIINYFIYYFILLLFFLFIQFFLFTCNTKQSFLKEISSFIINCFFFCEILKCQNLKFFSRISPYGNEKIFNVLSFIPIFFYLSPRKSKSKSGRRNSIVAVKRLFCRVRLLTVNKHKKRKKRKEKIKNMIRKQKIGVYRGTSCSTMHVHKFGNASIQF